MLNYIGFIPAADSDRGIKSPERYKSTIRTQNHPSMTENQVFFYLTSSMTFPQTGTVWLTQSFLNTSGTFTPHLNTSGFLPPQLCFLKTHIEYELEQGLDWDLSLNNKMPNCSASAYQDQSSRPHSSNSTSPKSHHSHVGFKNLSVHKRKATFSYSLQSLQEEWKHQVLLASPQTASQRAGNFTSQHPPTSLTQQQLQNLRHCPTQVCQAVIAQNSLGNSPQASEPLQ